MGLVASKGKVAPSPDTHIKATKESTIITFTSDGEVIPTTESTVPAPPVVAHTTWMLQPSSEKSIEDVYVIWLGDTPPKYDETQLKNALQKATSYIRVYRNPEEFLEFIESITTEKVIVLLNLNNDETTDKLKKQLELKKQVDSVWIILSKKHETVPKNFSKIKYFDSLDDATITAICERIRMIIRQTLDFNIFNRTEQRSTRDLTRNSAAFLWFQMLLNVLTLMTRDEYAKEEMLKVCTTYCEDNGDQKELKNIETYRETYISEHAVYWYTKDCFLYKLLNKALRSERIYLLCKFGTFIVDLSEQINKLYKERREHNGPETIKLYRGQYISKSELKQMRANVGQLISTNGFVSTTTEPEVATRFIKNASKSLDLLPLLFEITASTDLQSVAFADITHLSCFPDEKETLFRLGAVFKVDSIENHSTIPNLFVVKMTATDEGFETVKNYSESSKHDLEGADESILLGRLLIDMGQYKEAKIYFEELIESIKQTKKENDIACAPLYHNLGRVYACMGALNQAHKLMISALEIRQKNLSHNDPEIAHTLNSVGVIEGEMALYANAMRQFEKALQIFGGNQGQNKDDRRAQLRIASTKTNMGWIDYLQGNYVLSENFHSEALRIRQTHLQEDDPLIADNCNALGALHHAKGQYNKAKEYYEKALSMREKTLPPNHPAIANSYQSLGSLELENGQYAIALTHYKKALYIFNETLSADHLMIAGSYKSIGSVSLEEGDYDTALGYFERALKISIKSLSDNHPAAGECYHYMGMVHERKGSYETAIKYYKSTLDCVQGVVPIDHPSIAKIQNSLANAYLRKGDLTLSEQYLERSYTIQQKKYTNNHPDLVLTLNNLGVLYTHKNEYAKGEGYFQNALSMCKQYFPENRTALSRTYFNLGELKTCDQKYDQAIQNYQQALEIRAAILPDGDLSLADIHARLGYAYFNMHAYPQAEQHFIISRNTYRRQHPADHPDLCRVQKNLALIEKALQELGTESNKKK
jgi:tetratricopeptide (TPR) repeat protein